MGLLMSYTVETYEEFESRSDTSVPPRFLMVGKYETAEEAVEAAKSVIRKELAKFASSSSSLEDAIHSYRIYGEIPVIFGDPKVKFNPLEFLELIQGTPKEIFRFFGFHSDQ